MDGLARYFQPWGVDSLFIYTHEAHPGEKYPSHRSVQQKLEHARRFQSENNVQRTVLVDALSGDCHIHFGSMPNMSWIIDRQGRPFYKSDWTHPRSVRNALDHFTSQTAERKHSRLTMSPFRIERLEYRMVDRAAFLAHLKEVGQKAYDEYLAQLDRWGGQYHQMD